MQLTDALVYLLYRHTHGARKQCSAIREVPHSPSCSLVLKSISNFFELAPCIRIYLVRLESYVPCILRDYGGMKIATAALAIVSTTALDAPSDGLTVLFNVGDQQQELKLKVRLRACCSYV